MKSFLFVVTFIFFVSFNSQANIQYYRWSNQMGMTDNIQAILAQLNLKTGLNLTYSDFLVYEHRDMANYRFTTFMQTYQGIPIQGAMIRTWVDLKTGGLAQMEAHIEDNAGALKRAKVLSQKFPGADQNFNFYLTSMNTMEFVKQALAGADDTSIRGLKTQDQWSKNDLQRVIKVTGKHGTRTIVVSHFTKKIISNTYESFPDADVAALVYPIYEETEATHTLQSRVPVMLKNILTVRKQVSGDPYAALRTRHYFEDLIDPVLGLTPEGQAKGYWSFQGLMSASKALFDALPWEDNSYANGGIYLEGKYATVSLHPDVATAFKGIQFPLVFSGHDKFIEKEATDGIQPTAEMIPTGAYRGQLLADASSALLRPARRLPDHNPTEYINDGFDEIQVYYAINQLMDSLHAMGFSDPELSTRAFNAYLYDPDVSMRDNAYYTNDTINFTTYSPGAQNYARDNSTIWHELGHGVMDRLMGDLITLADTGGLSEGMADFVAKLVIEDVTQGVPFAGENDFRIINHTGFNLTNEVHDDGEAYGGTMRDIMQAAIDKFGRAGLIKMTDLTLETMRLTRNNPALTANDWFDHMMYADQMANGTVRAASEMTPLITAALASRNFSLNHEDVASVNVLVNDSVPLTGHSQGSRDNPNVVTLTGAQTASFNLAVSLKSSAGFAFKYPVKVETNYNGGPLEGAVKWVNESAGATSVTLNSEAEVAKLTVAAASGCDTINHEDGTCSDFAYIKIYNNGDTEPVAKKRFYVRVKGLAK